MGVVFQFKMQKSEKVCFPFPHVPCFRKSLGGLLALEYLLTEIDPELWAARQRAFRSTGVETVDTRGVFVSEQNHSEKLGRINQEKSFAIRVFKKIFNIFRS